MLAARVTRPIVIADSSTPFRAYAPRRCQRDRICQSASHASAPVISMRMNDINAAPSWVAMSVFDTSGMLRIAGPPRCPTSTWKRQDRHGHEHGQRRFLQIVTAADDGTDEESDGDAKPIVGSDSTADECVWVSDSKSWSNEETLRAMRADSAENERVILRRFPVLRTWFNLAVSCSLASTASASIVTDVTGARETDKRSR
jgi:hypothetical protein